MSKLTADTITDAQIRELQASSSQSTGRDSDIRFDCSVALADYAAPTARRAARARCAETFNARRSK